MWKFYHLFLGKLDMLYKNIKKKMKRTYQSQLLQSIVCSFKAKTTDLISQLLTSTWKEKQHSDLICIWWLSFINGKAVSLYTELRLGLASVLMHDTPEVVTNFLPISAFWKMSLWNVLLPASMWIKPSVRTL